MSSLWQLLQHEAVFGLQLVLAFSVSFSAVQLTRSWLSHTGMFAAKPAVYSARVFWPENSLAILPDQVKTPARPSVAAQPPAASPDFPEKMAAKPSQIQTRTVKSAKNTSLSHSTVATASPITPAKPAPAKVSEPIRVAVTQTPANQPPTRLKLPASSGSFSWSAPRAKRQPSYHAAKAQAQRSYRVAARPALQQAAASQRHEAVMQPLRKMLHDDYKVASLKSYDEYMSWVRKTLKSYQEN